MSYNSDIHYPEPKQPTPPQTPEHTAPAPEELFKQHVEQVSKGGDALDQHKEYRVPYHARHIATAMGLGACAVALEHNNGSVVQSTVVGVLLFTAQYLTRKHALRKYDKRAAHAYNTEAQEANDAQYDLYRTQRKYSEPGITMHWLGPRKNEQRLNDIDELKRVAQLAKSNNINTILIRPELIKGIASDTTAVSERVNMAAWLKANKRLLAIGEVEKDTVFEAAPDSWLTFAHGAKAPTEIATLYAKKNLAKCKSYMLHGSVKCLV